MTRPDVGLISTRTDSLDDSIESLESSIERIQERLKKVETRLVREFTRLEILIAESQSEMGRLQSSLMAMTSLISAGQRGGGGIF